MIFLQLDNMDEQAAQIRRELDGRLQLAEQIARVDFISLLSLHYYNNHFSFLFSTSLLS